MRYWYRAETHAIASRHRLDPRELGLGAILAAAWFFVTVKR